MNIIPRRPYRILTGDVREMLRTLPDESVYCVVTSPPYWGLRDYGIKPNVWDGDLSCSHIWISAPQGVSREQVPGSKQATSTGSPRDRITTAVFCEKCSAWRGQLGLEPTIELYVQHMVEVFREVRRVLRADGTLWLNMGDCYAGGGRGMGSEGCKQRTNAGSLEGPGAVPGKIPDGLSAKQLVGQPWRVAFALQADGWWLRSDIVWAKPNPMPESCRDRPTKSHEYVFMLTKSGASTFWTHRDKAGTCTSPEPDYIWIDRAAEYLHAHMAELWGEPLAAGFKALGFTPNLSAASGLVEHREEPEAWKTERFPHLPKSWPTAPHDKRWKRLNLWIGHDYFFDQEAVRENSCGAKEMPRRHDSSETVQGPGGAYRVGSTTAGRNIHSVWTIPTQAFPEAHFATFPEALPERCIKAGTSERGCCPECGAPWVRIVKKTRDIEVESSLRDGRRSKTDTSRNDKGFNALSGQEWSRLNQTNTTGWQPSCEHGRDPIPCTVLDPFVGSGTTALVAIRLGRRAIGIDLSPEYTDMVEKQLAVAVRGGSRRPRKFKLKGRKKMRRLSD